MIMLENLVARFSAEVRKYVSSTSTFQETEARIEFIDPFFSLLGWDMNNSNGLPSTMRDVLREESLTTESKFKKKPDYTFRIASNKKFYVEAKRPSVDIATNIDSAFQVRSYGYSGGRAVSILTNFRTLRVYDTTLAPKAGDDADVGLLISVDYSDYPSKYGELVAMFGRNEVAAGSIEHFFGIAPGGSVPVNIAFLNRINSWRIRIAQDLHTRYPLLVIEDLSDFAQKIINRIIFIRMCEDRGIEGEEMLRNVANTLDLVKLRDLFIRMDDRYNTGLFDVTQDRLNDTYELDVDLFMAIVDEIYAPNSPYSFSVLDADFFGQTYELFLCKRLNFDPSTNNIILEDKPDYEHREVVTTPQPLVDEVVRRAFSSKFEQMSYQNPLTLASILELRVLDVAVGSSRFLLRAFDELVTKAIEVLKVSPGQPHIYRITDDNYQLSFDIKRNLLRRCLFGIDIDYNAVEVARFSLMIRLLEDETSSTLPDGTKILPNLDQNIIHGNTIVSSDFNNPSSSIVDTTLPMNWALTALPERFDVIVGNPPYVKTEEMKNFTLAEFDYYKDKYDTAYKQFDKYFIFIELALSKMNKGAWFGMVVPNKWINIGASAKLRGLFAKDNLVSEIVDFGNDVHIFDGVSAYVCLLVLAKDGVSSFNYRHVNSYQDFLTSPQDKGYALPLSLITMANTQAWIMPSNLREAKVLTKLTTNATLMSSLVDVINGIQSSANEIYNINHFVDHGTTIEFSKDGHDWTIEKSITKPYINDSTLVKSYSTLSADARVIFPYDLSERLPVVISPSDMARNYPLALAYLTANKTKLEARSVSPPPAAGVFYAFGRHQALRVIFSSPKIIYSVNQRGDKYAIDKTGIACATGGTAGEGAVLNPKNGYALEFFLGLLNQKPIEFFVRKRGSPFGNGYFARGTAVLNDVPVPNLDIINNMADKSAHDAIVADVTDLNNVQDSLKTASGRNIQPLLTRKMILEDSLKSKFNALWGITTEMDSLVLPGDINVQ